MSRCVINVPSCQSAARPSLSAQMKQSDFPLPARSTLITKLRMCGRAGALRPRHCQGETRHSGNSESAKMEGEAAAPFLKYLTCTVSVSASFYLYAANSSKRLVSPRRASASSNPPTCTKTESGEVEV